MPLSMLFSKVKKLESAILYYVRPAFDKPARTISHVSTGLLVVLVLVISTRTVSPSIVAGGSSSLFKTEADQTQVSKEEVTAALAFYTTQPAVADVVDHVYAKNEASVTLAGSGVIANDGPVATRGQGWRAEIIRYTVKSGDTLSSIAAKHKVSTESIYWLNGISDADFLKIGQVIQIPPVSGLIHTVKTGETIDSVAAKYKIDGQEIVNFNDLKSHKLEPGSKIIIPGATKNIPNSAPRATSAGKYGSGVPRWGGGKFSKPTSSGCYNGYHWWAIDCPGGMGQAIWASDSGRIVVAKGGCPNGTYRECNGGLGNHIIIDHGNGFKTVYAHLSAMYYTGGFVNRGQTIGGMGCSGRTYGGSTGRCGIHLHFEIIRNGARQNPFWYL